MLHINIHVVYIHFIKFNLNLIEFQESNNYLKGYQLNKIEYFVELYFNLNEFEYQTGLSGELMIQYFPTLVMGEHKVILFHITPCHYSSY